MPRYFGIDTSNYTTSMAVYDSELDVISQQKKPLPVEPGRIGLRQSDAVFSHIKQLGDVTYSLPVGHTPDAIGVSVRPRDLEGSYMPCFLAGKMAAEVLSATLRVPLYSFSHQAGHLAAALYGAGCMCLIEEEFLAFHMSGGTTECLHVVPGIETPFKVEILSRSLDLFAGQLIDRVGAMLNLPFPSGPYLEELAGSVSHAGAKPVFRDGNPCLSGLENQCRKQVDEKKIPSEIAAYAIVSIANIVVEMTERALLCYPGLPVVYSGGVMSNRMIRSLVECRFSKEKIHFAPPQYSSDNAAGIAVMACRQREKGVPSCRF